MPRWFDSKSVYGLRRLQSVLLGAFALLVILILNAGAWWVYLEIGGYMERVFARSLKDAASLAAVSLSQGPDPMVASAEGPNSLSYLEIQNELERIREAGNFTDVFLIDTQGRNLVGLHPQFETGAAEGLTVLNPVVLEKAQRGRTALTETVQEQGLYFRAAFAPVTSFIDEPEAILVARADVEYMEPLRAVRNALIAATLLVAFLVAALAYGYGRTLKAIQRSEEKLIENERLASLGRMAAGIAHELRNPLGIIEQTMTVLRRRYEKQPDEIFDYIPSEVSRMNRIVTEFLDLARQSPLEVGPANLSSVIDRTLNLLEYKLRSARVEVKKDYPENCLSLIDPEKIQQVFLNLCLNAIEATEEGGALHVSATESRNGAVCVSFSDTGKGMSQEEVARAFDPFYTAKDGGTGLGLSVARQIVAQHGGSIEVESTPGKGTTMRVYLPSGGESRKNAD